MAKSKHTARKRTGPKARAVSEDLSAILGKFLVARCVVECASLIIDESDECADEAVCLRHGLDLMDSVYERLDLACCNLAVATGRAKL